jgi:peptidyl-prolyl cis-trans isomerase C
VPKEAEQIHARQILLYNADQANEVMAELEAGNDFGNLALKYDPLTGGDLDWFPRGYLPAENLEAAAFSLEPGQYTPVIETPAGFHILQVLERDPNRPLTPDALRALQIKALQEWLEMERAESEIQVLLP